MPNHSDDARHDKGHHVPSKPRRLIAGLALPTAAAVALVCAAAAGAVTSSSKGPSNLLLQNTAATVSAQPAVVESAAQRSTRLVEVARAEAVTVANARLVANAKAVAAAKKAHAARVARAEAKAAAADRAQAKIAARAQAAAARAQADAARAQAAVRAQAFARTTRDVARSNVRKRIAAQPASQPASDGAHGWQMPINNPVQTSGFGFRWGRLHAGNDYGVPVGTRLASMSSGKVTFAGGQSGYGNIVQIRYWDGTISYYGHMSSISVNVGQSVEAGQIVGRSGNTGHSTGPHLHLEIHPDGGKAVNPSPWLARHNLG